VFFFILYITYTEVTKMQGFMNVQASVVKRCYKI